MPEPAAAAAVGVNPRCRRNTYVPTYDTRRIWRKVCFRRVPSPVRAAIRWHLLQRFLDVRTRTEGRVGVFFARTVFLRVRLLRGRTHTECTPRRRITSAHRGCNRALSSRRPHDNGVAQWFKTRCYSAQIRTSLRVKFSAGVRYTNPSSFFMKLWRINFAPTST